MNLSSTKQPSPLRLLVIIGLSIAAADVVASLIIDVLGRPGPFIYETLDSIILLGISFPFLFFYMYRPLVRAAFERSKAEEEAAQLAAAIGQATEAVFITDKTGVISYVNPAFQRITGYSPDEAVGQNIDLLKSGQNDAPIIEEFEHAFRNEKSWGGILVIRRKGGGFYYAQMSIAPVRGKDGEVRHFVSIHDDISPQKENELALMNAKEEAVAATKLKDKFVLLVAHDLRSPFSAIMGLLQLMKKDANNPLPPSHLKTIDKIMTTSDNMLRMIDEILSISRLRTGAIIPHLRYLIPRALADEVIDGLFPLSTSKGIMLENLIPAQLKICADPSLYREVIQNLVSNAIKFTPEGGRVTLSLAYGGGASIEVRDTGVGMTNERAMRLFAEGEKTSTSGTAGERGNGFGLMLSQSIMKAHGGEITVSSFPGSGSTFRAALPPLKPRVLVVEDDADCVELIIVHLAKLGLAVRGVQTVKEALVLLEQDRYDLILTDLLLPGEDGYHLIGQVRSHARFASVPAIVITASADPEDRIKAFNMGANDYLVKPIVEEELVLRVKRFTG